MPNRPYYDPGAYIGEVISQSLGTSKKGTPQFTLRFKVLAMADGVAVRQQYERTLYMPLTEKTVRFAKEALQRIGFTGNNFQQLDPARPGYHNFAGLETQFYCKHEEYMGQTNERWQISRYATPPKPSLQPDTSQIHDLDEVFPKAHGRNPIVNDHGLTVTDEDIPF